MSTESNNETQRFRCRHVFTDGRRCASPALRAQPFCYYHHTSRRPVPLQEVHRRRQFADVADGELSSHQAPGFVLPPAADLTERSGVQHTLGLILARIAANEIDPRRAGLLLYGLQIASMNLPKHDPNADLPETVDEITEDPIHGTIAPPAEYVPKPTFDFTSLLADNDEEEEEEEEEEQEDLDDDLEDPKIPEANLPPRSPKDDAGEADTEDDPTLRYLATLHAASIQPNAEKPASPRGKQAIQRIKASTEWPIRPVELLRNCNRNQTRLGPDQRQNLVDRILGAGSAAMHLAHPLGNQVADLIAGVAIRNRSVDIVRAQEGTPVQQGNRACTTELMV